jgi:multimeric flavodoxin WrbA
MTGVAIVYSSGNGHTRTVAEHIQQGADGFPATRTELIEITAAQLGESGRWRDEHTMSRLAAADAIIFGAPTYMGFGPWPLQTLPRDRPHTLAQSGVEGQDRRGLHQLVVAIGR